jgi:hypothetical protein
MQILIKGSQADRAQNELPACTEYIAKQKPKVKSFHYAI